MLRKKNFLVVTILILLVFLVTGCSGVLPKPTKGVISGRVLIPPTAKQLSKDISGWVGAAGAEVTIVDANGVKHTVITDENGYYNFENIAVKANTVVTATVKVDGKTMVLKTVIDKAVGKEQKYDSGAMTPESTALAIVVEHIQDVGGIVNLDEIKETDSYLDLLGKVTEVLEAQGNVEDDAGVQDLADEAVDEILYPDDGTPTPPSGGGPTTVAVSAISVEGVVDDLFVGTVLTAKTAPSGANVNYQWLRASEINTDDEDYEPIDEATGKTYELTADDAGNYIKVKAEGKGRYKGTVISEEAVGPVETLVPGELTIVYNYNDEEETKTVQYIARNRAYEKLTLPVGAALQSLTVTMDGITDENNDDVKIEFKEAPTGYESPWGTLKWEDGKWQLKSATHGNYQNLQENAYELQATFISKAEKELTVAIEVEVEIETIEASIDYNAVWNESRGTWYIKVTVPDEDLDTVSIKTINVITEAGQDLASPKELTPDTDKVMWFGVAKGDGGITLKENGEYAYKVVRKNDTNYIFNFTYVSESVAGVALPAVANTTQKTGYDTLEAAVDEAYADDTLILGQDVILSKRLVLDKSLVLDGNDKTIFGKYTSNQAVLAPQADNITIKNVTMKGEENVILINTTSTPKRLTIDNVIFDGDGGKAKYGFYAVKDFENLEITNSEFKDLKKGIGLEIGSGDDPFTIHHNNFENISGNYLEVQGITEPIFEQILADNTFDVEVVLDGINVKKKVE